MIDEWEKGAKYWDHAWNPVVGCEKISEGCENCYATSMAERFPELQDENGGFTPHAPKYQKNPPKHGVVFVGNMTDIFGEWNEFDVIRRWLGYLSLDAVNLVLTKRKKQLAETFFRYSEIVNANHIFYGITAENQTRLEERLPSLFSCKKRWLSLEPLLGNIDLIKAGVINDELPWDKSNIDWVVVGAESGPNRRPCKLDWVRGIVHQCRYFKIPVFVKQLDINGKLEKDISKFPADLQIRQVPWRKK